MGILTYSLPRNSDVVTDIIDHIPKNWGGMEGFFVSPREVYGLGNRKFLDLSDIIAVRPISDLLEDCEENRRKESLNGQGYFDAVRINREFEDNIKETRLLRKYIKACLEQNYIGYFYLYNAFLPKKFLTAEKVLKFSNRIYDRKVQLKFRSKEDILGFNREDNIEDIKDIMDLKKYFNELKLKKIN
ncbi:hypothetical protein J4414_02010 [Candidatus Woesearchaeota archaeon]|nr:hypothetical protein [Candidatus Woesearchaeota archaeon]